MLTVSPILLSLPTLYSLSGDKLPGEVITPQLPQPNKCPRDQESRPQTHEKLAGLPQSGGSSHLSQSISAFCDLELGEAAVS